MHVPKRRPLLGLAAVEPITKDPEVGTPVIFEAVIISRTR
jgi:hypothetical protein